MIYPTAAGETGALDVGTGGMLRVLRPFLQEAAQKGFTQLRLTAWRTVSQRWVKLTIDLTRYK